MKGKVVYFYAFDVADEIRTSEVREFLALKPAPFRIQTGRQVPKDVRIYPPLAVTLPEEACGSSVVQSSVRIFDVGVVSISFEVEVDVPGLQALTPYHTATIGGISLAERAEALAARTVTSLRAHLTRPNEEKTPVEAYTVFCLRDVPGDVSSWAAEHRAAVAALLNEDPDPGHLAPAQVDETWSHCVSYSVDDLAVIDWDAALVVDRPGTFEDVLYVIEMANLQLEEFRLLDDRLDRSFERAYDDLERYAGFPRNLFSPRARLRGLRSMRMDITKMSEEVSNITKFVGDWHLARVYLACKDRFHLGHWESSVDQKLQEIDRLYTIVHADITERRSLILEIMIVALFVIDILALFFWKK